ncbi:MAG: radical SAM protein [Candidatus Diapherotrites archaeon]|uniref:Radical SAM protein n=1 Tax=Candidatus Iainarchaeum sp. TaxID=3101447 RepID=A0A939C7I6_9ARCH|nr:radical SAM protein [Candidatus Diapherotrites archaeon]
MRVLMLNPPFFPKYSRSSRSPCVTKGGTLYYPIWLAYATGVLEQAGHKCKLVDAPASGKTLDDVKGIAKKFRPEMIVSDTSTPSIYNDVHALEELRKETDVFSALVGTHPSALPLETLQLSEKIDAVAVHEYDYSVRELAENVEKGRLGEKDLKKVKGIAFRSGKKLQRNEDRPLIQNLDELPFVSGVYKRHLNYKDYFYSANLWPEVTIVTGRGCPFNCKFCYWVQVLNTGAYRVRSVPNVIEEFQFIEENFPEAKEVFLEDDTFTGFPKRVEQFCDEKAKQGIKIRWSCNARVDTRLETLQKMKKAGCRLLCVGFESGSQDVLNNVSKGTTPARMEQFMQDTKKAGIMVHGCFMVGNQGETAETIRATIELAKKLDPDTAQFFPIMVYPGTASYREFKKKGWIVTEDYSKWLDERGWHNCMVSRPGLSNNDLVEWCDKARKEFYLRPKYMGKKAVQVATNPREARRIAKAGRTFFKYLWENKAKEARESREESKGKEAEAGRGIGTGEGKGKGN